MGNKKGREITKERRQNIKVSFKKISKLKFKEVLKVKQRKGLKNETIL